MLLDLYLLIKSVLPLPHFNQFNTLANNVLKLLLNAFMHVCNTTKTQCLRQKHDVDARVSDNLKTNNFSYLKMVDTCTNQFQKKKTCTHNNTEKQEHHKGWKISFERSCALGI